MPLTYQQFLQKQSSNKNEFDQSILPQMEVLEAALRETLKSLNNENPRPAERINAFKTMADAMQTLTRPGRFTLQSTKNNAMAAFGGLRDFLEAENGRNFDLIEETVKAHPELLSSLPQAERRKPMLERYRDLSGYFDLGYYPDYEKRNNRAFREGFTARRDRDRNYRSFTVKQIDFLSAALEQVAEGLEPNSYDYHYQIVDLRQAARDLRALQDPNAAEALDKPLQRLKALPELLEQNNGELAGLLRDAAEKNPKLKELLPDDPAARKMPTLQHLTELFSLLSLKPGARLQELAFAENEDVREKQNVLDAQKELDEIRKDDEAEAADAEEDTRFRRLEQELRQKPLNEKKKEDDRRAAFTEAQESFRREHGPFVLPPEYDGLDAAGMLLSSAKENGEQYRALVNFRDKLDAAVRQWDSYFAEGGVFDRRLAEELAKLPEDGAEELRDSAIDEALNAVSAAEQERFLRNTVEGGYEARLAEEQKRLGPDATPEQARASLYREELAESLRAPLREQAYSQEQIEKSSLDAALALAAERRDAMDPQALLAYQKDKAQLRNDVIARRIRDRLLALGRSDEDFRKAFLNDQMPTVDDRQAYYLAHDREAELVNNYRQDGEQQEIALYNSRVNELLNEALYDKTKWKQMNQLLEKLGVPASMRGADRKALMDHVLSAVQDETLDDETEQAALEKLSKTIPAWEVERRARRMLPLAKDDRALLYGWAREQKQAQLRREVRQEQRQTLSDLHAFGVNRARLVLRDLNRILPACSFVLPAENENAVPAFDYKQALAEDDKLDFATRQQLGKAYDLNLAAERNGEQPEPEIDPKLSAADKRAIRAQRRETRHWRRTARLDLLERSQAAEEKRRRAIDNAKNLKASEQHVTVGASLNRLLKNLQGTNLTQGELGQAFQELDRAWTRGDLQTGKALKQELRFRPNEIADAQRNLDGEDHYFIKKEDDAPEDELQNPKADPLPAPQDDEEQIERKFTEVEDDFLFREDNDGEKAPKELGEQAPKYYVFQPEYVDPELEQQNELLQDLQEDLNPGGTQPGDRPVIVVKGKVDAERLRDLIRDHPNAQIHQIQHDPIPGFDPQRDGDALQQEPRNAGEEKTASAWIKRLRSKNLYTVNAATQAKELDLRTIAYIMAARDLANSVRGSKTKLLEKTLTMAEIKARAAELGKQPDFTSFIAKLKNDETMRRNAVSAVGSGHGGGLDDMFKAYLAQKEPGELPTHPDLQRWMPSALQRIEGLQAQLKTGKLDEFQARKRVAEIIAARKQMEARRAGALQHADKRLNRKLDPAKLKEKAETLETCLKMLSSDQNQQLIRKAQDGHGGAMLEAFKPLNTVRAHMAQINGGLAFSRKEVDAALAMAVFNENGRENGKNQELQLDDTKAFRTAAAIRKFPFYPDFEQKEDTQDKLKQNVNIQDLCKAFVQVKDACLQQQAQAPQRGIAKDRHSLQEDGNELEFGQDGSADGPIRENDPNQPVRSNTVESILGWK